jgi:hypothetical protein
MEQSYLFGFFSAAEKNIAKVTAANRAKYGF